MGEKKATGIPDPTELLRAGTLGAYLLGLPPAAGARDARRASRALGPPAVAAALLGHNPPHAGARAPLWAALLREDTDAWGGGQGPPGQAWGIPRCRGLQGDAWGRLAACLRADPRRARGALRVPTLAAAPPGMAFALADLAAAAFGPRERARLLARRGGEDGLAHAMAMGLAARALRRAALARAAGYPGEDPRRGQGLAWAHVRAAGPASRGRAARWLLARPVPAWRAAWAAVLPGRGVGAPTPAATAGLLRAMARAALTGPGPASGRTSGPRVDMRGVGQALARARGPQGDRALVAALLQAPPGTSEVEAHRALLDAESTLAEDGATPGALGMAEAALLGTGALPDLQRQALALLGGWLPREALGTAAEVLWGRGDMDAARHLVRHAPELAGAEALARSGLLPGTGFGANGTLKAGRTTLRRAPGGALRRAPGSGKDGPDATRLRRADRALRTAWAEALGGEG